MFFVVSYSFSFIYPSPNFDFVIDAIKDANVPFIKVYTDNPTIDKPSGYIILNIRLANYGIFFLDVHLWVKKLCIFCCGLIITIDVICFVSLAIHLNSTICQNECGLCICLHDHSNHNCHKH